MNKSLYEITGQYLELLNMLDDESINDQIIRDTLSAIDGEIEEKADNYAKIIKNLDRDIDALKNECKRLTARIKTLENRRNTLKEHLKKSMLATGKIKFRTTLFSFSVAKNGGKTSVIVKGDVPEFFSKARGTRQRKNTRGARSWNGIRFRGNSAAHGIAKN